MDQNLIGEDTIIEKLYSGIIAILPILAIYRDLFGIAELGTILLIILMPVVIWKSRFITKSDTTVENLALIGFGVDALISVFAWGSYSSEEYRTAIFTVIIMVSCFLMHIIFGRSKIFKLTIAIRVTRLIAIFNSVLIILQYFFHYVLGSYINIYFGNMLIEQAQHYISYLASGVTQGSFRPAGIFLEPSHSSLYTVIALWSVLFFDEIALKEKYKIALLISIGTILTTSGIGIALIVFLWTMKAVELLSKRRINAVIGGIFLAVIALIILMQTSFFGNAISRVFTGNMKTSAVYTRIYNIQLLLDMSGKNLWIGYGFNKFPTSFLSYSSGIVKMIYGQGIVGTALFIIILIWRIKNSSFVGKVLAIVICGLIVVAELYNTTYLVFYFMYLFSVPRNNCICTCASSAQSI